MGFVEFSFTKKKIILNNKVVNRLDEFVLTFTSVLDRMKINYVIVSGYVAIVFGRSRATEDIDIIAEPFGKKKFEEFWSGLEKEFDCINAPNAAQAYDDYISQNIALRFFEKGGKPIPNIEFKFPKNTLDERTLKDRVELLLDGKQLFVSPIEIQIAFKLFLGSEKDFEDARHLYKVFAEEISLAELKSYAKLLKVEEKLGLAGVKNG